MTPLAVAIASTVLSGSVMDSKEAWIQVAKETSAIVGIILCSFIGAVAISSATENKENIGIFGGLFRQ
ncbi:MAG: hypothetical protein JSR58_00650 [Verrucomicrobia bacterium]|nr:hypothetical protein [Verrucomicrobiota bacterium]